jgi:hypothetical protein
LRRSYASRSKRFMQSAHKPHPIPAQDSLTCTQIHF